MTHVAGEMHTQISPATRTRFHDRENQKANFMTTTPQSLYSIIVDYQNGDSTAQHFPTERARHDVLLNQAENMFTDPSLIPAYIRADDRRLADCIQTMLLPARVILTEASLKMSDGTYQSDERAHINQSA